MPIGKNSIKRVANNGYSKVNSSAPDMENSEIKAEAPKKAAVKKAAAPVKKAEPKKAAAPAKKAEPKKAAVIDEATQKNSSICSVGDEMPVFLL